MTSPAPALPADDVVAFKPLVVGAPRSGFALLTAVAYHLASASDRPRWSIRQQAFNALLEGADAVIATAIVAAFADAGITTDLIYNPNFRKLTGGPKWLREGDHEQACFRKYIGVRGGGDFTLITAHPREVLDSDLVVHSHTDPGLWLRHPGYRGYTKFASLRNPVGILNSSVFSINALASEYIQKFVPAERDTDRPRQQLALYKLTDLDFVRGLTRFLVSYLEEFVRHWRSFHVMRWEDLILTPVPTIMRLARASGVAIDEARAAAIWQPLDHVNLTGHHRHNYRAGKGIVGNWREWLVNEHLELFAEMGLEPLMRELGYGAMPRLREDDYTPFQRKVQGHVRRGTICRETEDSDLFTFAFNKSNLSSEAFPFRRYPWRTFTRIERSIFVDEDLERRIWDVAEATTGRVNAALSEFLRCGEDATIDQVDDALTDVNAHHAELFAPVRPAMDAAIERARTALRQARAAGATSAAAPASTFSSDPVLVDSRGGYNIVGCRGVYFVVPQSLGELRIDGIAPLPPSVLHVPTLRAARQAVDAATGGSLAGVSPPAGDSPVNGARLTLVEPIPEAFAAACRQQLDAGSRRLLLTPINEFSHRLVQFVLDDVRRAGGQLLVEGEGDVPDGCARGTRRDADAVFVCETDEPALSAALLTLVDRDAPVVAAIGPRHWTKQPLFLISVPKAGTHLLYALARAMGYTGAVVLQDDPTPGSWYCVEYSNSHTVARDFFVDTVRRSPFGNRHHPFMRSPALFIYRNPLDVVASEANFYHRDGNSAFAGYLQALTPEQRLLRLIDDPWLLGSIRDRVGGFIPWLELPNVIPVSFEELVGANGGGTSELQQRAVWSIQLRLQVPGAPAELARQLFDPESPTFDRAQIGRYRQAFTDDAYRRFFALPQDFMQAYGYAAADRDHTVIEPSRAAEFRARPLRVTDREPDVPVTIQDGYLGFNIVRFAGEYFVVSQSEGELDVRSETIAALRAAGRVAVTRTAEGARRAAEYLAFGRHVEKSAADRAAREREERGDGDRWVVIRTDWFGHNLLRRRGRFYAVAQHLGPADLDAVDDATLRTSGDMLVADTLEAIEEAARLASPPTLLRADVAGFNLLEFRGAFYAVAQSLGSCDLATADLPALLAEGSVLTADSAADLELAVERQPVPHPVFIRDDYRGFNIIKFGRTYYAAARRLGPFDLETADIPAMLATGDLLAGDSPAAAEAAVDAARERRARERGH